MKLDDIKKVMAALIDMGELADKIKNAPSGITTKVMAGFAFLVSQSADLVALGGVTASELKAEIAALDDAGKAELVAFFKQKLDLEEDQIEAKIEAAVSILVKLEGAVEEAINLVKGKLPVSAAPAV